MLQKITLFVIYSTKYVEHREKKSCCFCKYSLVYFEVVVDWLLRLPKASRVYFHKKTLFFQQQQQISLYIK